MSSLLWAHKQLEGRGKRLAFNDERSNKKHTRTTKMTDEQINAAIAEVCGWEDITESVAPEEFRRRATGMLRDKHGNRTPLKQIPNYCADLNAMHEAERVLTKAQWQEFVDDLAEGWGSVSDAWKDVCHATARQRAEAFLRTLGKWEEEQK
jgi:hypothetical protein